VPTLDVLPFLLFTVDDFCAALRCARVEEPFRSISDDAALTSIMVRHSVPPALCWDILDSASEKGCA
jgi:hypothetical protein